MGMRDKLRRYDRPGSSRPHVFPGRTLRKRELRRSGDRLRQDWNDTFCSRRDRNRVRRAADRAAIAAGLADHHLDANPYRDSMGIHVERLPDGRTRATDEHGYSVTVDPGTGVYEFGG